jgi:tight adherence protein B
MAATSVAISALCFHAILAARAQKRSQRIVQQLPAFLDDIVCLVGHGNRFPLAFQAAAADAQAPLSECLEQVTSRLHSGTEIDQALAAAARIYRVKELELIGAVLRISIRFGGHSDMVLERLASSMREVEQADRGRVAPSAETHLSPWVLGLLPALLGGAVIVLNAEFLESIWGGALDEHLVYGAIGLQALGAYVLYRLARLRV